jgi:hypothetical protein
MNRSILFLFLLAWIVQSQVAKSQFLPFYEKKSTWNNLPNMNLKGNVKAITQTSFIAIDSAGVVIKGAKGSKSDQCTVNSDFDMRFDNKGRTLKEIFFNVRSVSQIIVNHKYDDIRRTEEIKEESDGKTSFIYNYAYNDKGKMVICNIIQYPGSHNQQIKFKYDKKGNMIESVYNNSKDEFKTIYKYDSTGNQTAQETFDSRGLPFLKETYKVDNKENVLEHNYYSPGCKTIDHKMLFKYDSKGNVTQREFYQPADKLAKTSTCKYEYDQDNNWAKRIDFENGKAMFVLERKLEYY